MRKTEKSNERKGRAKVRCTNCGKELKEGERYCTKCWTEAAKPAEHTHIDIQETDQDEPATERMVRMLTLWVNDIEISKTPYIATIILLILGIILSRQPVFEISGLGQTLPYALHEVEALRWASMGIIVLNIVCIILLLIPMMKMFEWKTRWFAPVGVVSLVECGAAVFILGKKNELLETTLVGYVYKMLEIKVNITATGWALIITFVLTFVCAVKMLVDVKNNEIKY